MLTGTPEADVLEGQGEDDTISGLGGADLLSGGGGNDTILQTAPTANFAAGTIIDGGSGDDRLTFDGINAYTADYIVMRGGSGADTILVSTGAGQYSGAVQVEGGDGDDLIRLGGNIQGGEGGRGYADGGDGNDVLEILAGSNGVGIWGNRQFELRGGTGDDLFLLGGTQIQYSQDTAARLDGGAGFDTLVWNGSYNLTLGGHQNAALDLYAGKERGIAASSVERLDIASSGVTGLAITLTAADVEAITAGSDFDRSTLGLGLTGTGNTLFVDPGNNGLDLAGWSLLGNSLQGEARFFVYDAPSGTLLVVSDDIDQVLVGTPDADILQGFGGDDTISGLGGADVLSGGGGNDTILQTAPIANFAAGTIIDGGSGDDRLTFDGINAYTADYIVMRGGSGADTILVSTGAGQYSGAVQVEGGDGDDLIRLGGNIQGGEGGRGYADGGAGNDVIEVLTASNGSGIGIWGNRQFELRGGTGDDLFLLGGTQIQYSQDTAARLDGGAGFDTLVWNGSYNLTLGGHQNAALDLYAGKERGIAASSVERLDIASSGVTGLAITLTAADVEAITAGSDFDRSTLGLGLTGTGNTLFVDPGNNGLDLAGWSLLGNSLQGEARFFVYDAPSGTLLVVSDDIDQVLVGTPDADILQGFGGDDTISGLGGADVLSGGGGNDTILQTAPIANFAAGTIIDGGSGDDRLTFDGINAYTADYIVMRGGSGADTILVSTGAGQYSGAVQVEGGDGDDLIRLGGNIQGGEGGRGYADGGAGNDVIEVLTASNGSGIGIWGNRQFELRGGMGDDLFLLGGTQIQFSQDTAARLDGGAGSDTLVWNGSYNLTPGGHQNAALDLYEGKERGIAASNVERLDIASSGVTGLAITLTAADVEAITAGSDFDRSTLGLGLTGTGNTLFVDPGTNSLDLAGWSSLGTAQYRVGLYEVFQASGGQLLALSDVSARTLIGTPDADILQGFGGDDTISGLGGADVLSGGGGNDTILQTAPIANFAAGTIIDGGSGDDRLTFDGINAYTADYIVMRGGSGADTILVSTGAGQYSGAVQVEGGDGDDLIRLGGNIQGGEGGRGYADGGAGNDVIEVLTASNGSGIGIWGNRQFELRGGMGDDLFLLGGTQIQFSQDTAARLDGGAGSDTLVWNGSYNLTPGGHQNAALDLYEGKERGIAASNIERLDLASSGVTGLTIGVGSDDVEKITAGSDFDRSTLGLGLTGTGNTLLVDPGENSIDLSDWSFVGISDPITGSAYHIYSHGDSLLGLRHTHAFEQIAFAGTNILADLDGDGAFDQMPLEQTAVCCLTCLMGEIGSGQASADATTITVLDVNNDGVFEIYRSVYNSPVSGQGVASLYYQDGEGNWICSEQFAAMEIRGHIEQGTPFDYDNDGFLDLFLPRYAIDNPETAEVDYEPGSLLLRNNGGTFVDVTGSTPVSSLVASDLRFFTDNRQPEGVVPVDVNWDGNIDLYVAGHLLLNDGMGGFVDANAAYRLGGEFDEGISINDFDNDGWLDIVRNDTILGPSLLRGSANGFELVPNAFRGEAVYTNALGAGSWGIAAIDLNSDGLLDLVINGTSEGDAKYFLNAGSYFSRVDNPVDFIRGYSLAVGDIDRNGTQDFSVVAGGTFLNMSTPVNGSLRIGLFGENGETNQAGRVLSLASIDHPETIRLAPVQIASGYHAQNEYMMSIPLPTSGAYRITHSPLSSEQSNAAPLDLIASSGWTISLYGSATSPTRVDAFLDGQLARGGADGSAALLLSGEGNDTISLRAGLANEFAGTIVDGGGGDDRLTFDGINAYTADYIVMRGGSGADTILVSTGAGQYSGAVQVEGGDGDDLIRLGGNVQGGEGGRGYADGGAGNDVIEVLTASNGSGIGIWGNRQFQLRGGTGDDLFLLGGTQIQYSQDTAARLDGGAGFDTLVWNGSYNLTLGGHQNPALDLYAGKERGIAASNIERLDIASSGVTGLAITLTAADVEAITAGSDFDRSTLGLGLTGTGNTLFVDPGNNSLSRESWVSIGSTDIRGTTYELLRADGGDSIIGVVQQNAAPDSTAILALSGLPPLPSPTVDLAESQEFIVDLTDSGLASVHSGGSMDWHEQLPQIDQFVTTAIGHEHGWLM